MNRYTLTARLGKQTRRATLWCEDSTDAAFTAIAKVLDRAKAETDAGTLGPWARGEIILTDPFGAVLHRMDPK